MLPPEILAAVSESPKNYLVISYDLESRATCRVCLVRNTAEDPLVILCTGQTRAPFVPAELGSGLQLASVVCLRCYDKLRQALEQWNTGLPRLTTLKLRSEYDDGMIYHELPLSAASAKQVIQDITRDLREKETLRAKEMLADRGFPLNMDDRFERSGDASEKPKEEKT